MFEWRKFNFFDLKQVGDEEKIKKIVDDAEIVSSTCGNNQIILGDSRGFCHVFPKNWEAMTFKAHTTEVVLCELSIQNNLLVTIGADESGSIPEFKVWNLSKLSKSIPACIRTVKTNLQKPTALAVSEGGQFMAIGFERGNVSFYKGDISRDKSKTAKTLTFGTSSVRGIAFKHIGKITQMFVCSDSGVYLYTIQGRDKELKSVLDTITGQVPTTCCSLQTGHNEGHFMIGRDDAIYCYTSDGRGPCYAIEGRKFLIRWFRSHLLIVTSPIRENNMQVKTYTLTVIDVVNKFIVFTTQVEPLASIFVEFGTCYLVTVDKKLYHLDEKDLQSKLSSLFKKNLYDTAVKIAKNNQYDAEGLADIFKQYGDHLYLKGNFSGAVEQYIKTIGFLEPSYIIRRFLDSRHTQYLTDYLECLHKEGKATADHTTLLLNCFTRLDRITELKIFLDIYKQNNSLFDIDVAIKVCRKSCIEQALELAKINRKHDFAVSILIEDMKLYDETLEYIGNLSYEDAEINLKKYGNLLMEQCPEKTTELLKKLCTEYIISTCGDGGGAGERHDSNEVNDRNYMYNMGYRNNGFSDEKTHGTPEDFSHLFNDTTKLIDYIEYLIKNLPVCTKLAYNTLLEHYLLLWEKTEDGSSERKTCELRMLELIKNCDEFYDKSHVLVLCRTFEFWAGVMLIYEEQKLYNLIVRHYLKTKDYPNLYMLCKRLGSIEPTIWTLTLNGLRMDSQVPTSFLQEILQIIGMEKLQSPLQVLDVLGSIENGPVLSSVRSYFTQIFQKENEVIRQEEESSEKYRMETEVLKKQIHSLNNEPIEFRGTLCDACHQPLHLPALYFLCKHSFHQDCIRSYSETEKDCMVCRKKNNQLIDIVQSQNESRNNNHLFQDQLNASHEPFSVTAEYFGRGLFNKIVLISEDDDNAKENVDSKFSSVKRIIPDASKKLPMTEGKIRIEEGLRNPISLKPQVSEGRMRLQEQNSAVRAVGGSPKMSSRKPLSSAAVAPAVTTALTLAPKKVKVKATVPVNYPKNPFDDDDNDYEKSKNPFGDEEEATEKTTNPFGDVDD